MASRSLYYLCKEVLGYKDVVPHVHGDMCDFATNPRFGRFRQATVPRSWFKTWTLTIGKAIWLTLPDEDGLFKSIFPYKGPNARILIASNVIDNAAKMVNKIKSEWQNNDRLKAAFPELVPDTNKTRWSDHCAQVKRPGNFTEGTYTAVGVGGSVISQHFDHIIEDDLVYAKKDDFSGQELMPSQEDIENAIGWHKLTFSLLADPQHGCIDNVGTRWAPHDVIRYIREQEKQYSTFEVNATIGATWPIPDNSFCVWPERYDKECLENIRMAQGPKIFETQYLNRPRSGEDVTFEVAYVNRHNSLKDYPHGLTRMTYVDLAGWKDTTKRLCRNVVLTGARDDKNNLWVYRVDAGRFNPTEVIELIKAHVKQFDTRVFIEEVGYQTALRHFAKLDMEKEGSFAYHIEPLPMDNSAGAKTLRIQSIQPVVKNGMLHVLESMNSLMGELEDYPYSSTKDILDCVGFLNKYAKRPTVIPAKVLTDPFSLDSIEQEILDKKGNSQYPFENPLDSGALAIPAGLFR